MYQHIQESKDVLFKQKYLHSTNLAKSYLRPQKRLLPWCTWLKCTDSLAGEKIASEVKVFLNCSSCSFYISNNKLEYVLFDACFPTGLGNIECTKDDVIGLPSQSEA